MAYTLKDGDDDVNGEVVSVLN